MSKRLLVLILLASCGSAPVSKEKVDQEQLRLLAPFLGGGEVGCDQLVVEMTGNFAIDNVAQPAVDKQLHGVTKERGDSYTDTIWINKRGDLPGAFTVTIGIPQMTEHGLVTSQQTKFTVVHQVRFRVFEGRHTMALNVWTSGKTLVKEAGQFKDVEEYRVEDGSLRRK